MDLIEAKRRLVDIEGELPEHEIVEFAAFQTPYECLTVSVTDRLRRRCRKGGMWKSKGMLTALKNSAYGYNPDVVRSRGGADGIFLLDRGHRPANSMMKKMFDRFLDKPDLLATTISRQLDVEVSDLLPVRLVSHHMRLLGVMAYNKEESHLVLIDYDNEKGG